MVLDDEEEECAIGEQRASPELCRSLCRKMQRTLFVFFFVYVKFGLTGLHIAHVP